MVILKGIIERMGEGEDITANLETIKDIQKISNKDF